MAVEIEKKYRLTGDLKEALLRRLREAHAESVRGEEFEENVIYSGPGLEPRNRVLRLRRTGGRATFTYKERYASNSAIKRQREEETAVSDADALAAILEALGYRPALVYEKRRATWRLAGVEVVMDELPFGLFLEIEGDETLIQKTELLLGLADAEPEHESYPQLTIKHGEKIGDLVEARFPQAKSAS